MFGLRWKSIRLYLTLCFVLLFVCAADVKDTDPKDVAKEGGKEGDPKDVATDGIYPDPKDVATDGGKEGDPKDVATDGIYPDPKDVATDDVKDTDLKDVAKKDLTYKDQVTQLLESLSPEDIAKLENMTDKELENKTAFLSPEEGCDFLRVGLFDDPDYHKGLLHDYVVMERFGYWEMRCEEFAYKDPDDANVKDAAAQKPSYCP